MSEPLSGEVRDIARPVAFGQGYSATVSPYASSAPRFRTAVPPPDFGATHAPFYFVPAGATEAPTPVLGSQAVPSFDLAAVRSDFPALAQQMNGHPLVFLDNAATTHKPNKVIEATSHFYSRDNSNIHRAAYELAQRATAAFEQARSEVQHFLGAASEKEIVFLRGTTEAVNLVSQAYGRKFFKEGDEIVLTELEHHANIVPWQLLRDQIGVVLKVVPIDDRGELILEEYAKLLGPRTRLVSVAHVSNALGTINPVELIASMAHAVGALVFVDGAQSAPHMPVNVQALGADFYAFSGHKVFGPTGIGVLYGKADLLEQMPPWQGGGHMIRDVRFEGTLFQNAPEKFEAGTPDIAGAVGLGAALSYLTSLGREALAAYEEELLHYATGVLSGIPGLRFIGTAPRKAGVLSFVLENRTNAEVADFLDTYGVAVRAGHHCAMPAHRRFGLESSVRPSIAFYNTRQEIDFLGTLLQKLVKFSISR